jgi:CcmD family protein
MKQFKGILALITLFASTALKAGTVEEVLRGNAKHNVVITVLIVIFLGIALYMLRLDRKINKLDK